MLGAGEGQPIASGWFVARRNRRARRCAGRGRAPGRRRDPNRRRTWRASSVAGRRGHGVTLASGETIAAARRRVERRSEADAARSRRSDAPRAGDRAAPSEHPRARHAREDQLRGVGACRVSTVSAALHGAERAAALSGRIRLARDVDGIERAFDAAKYGALRRRAVDRADHSVDRRSGAGAARRSTSCRRTCSTRPITCAARRGMPSANASR